MNEQENGSRPPSGQPGARPASPSVTRISAPAPSAPDAQIRIPTPPPPAPPEAPTRPGSAGLRAAPPGGAPEAPPPDVGRPQLRPPELKLESAGPAGPSRPAPLLRAPRSAASAWGVRIALLVGMAFALGLLYWSVFVRFLPVTTEHRDKALEMTRLSDELERLRARWSPVQIEETKEHYERAKKTLFDPSRELVQWQTNVQDQARMRVFEAALSVDNPQALPAPAEGMSSVTARVTVQPSAVLGGTEAPYARLLKFTEALANTPKRLDLIELSVIGDSNSVSRAEAVVQLMTAEKPL